MKQKRKELNAKIEQLTKENAELKFRQKWDNRGKPLSFKMNINSSPFLQAVDKLNNELRKTDRITINGCNKFMVDEVNKAYDRLKRDQNKEKMSRWLFDEPFPYFSAAPLIGGVVPKISRNHNHLFPRLYDIDEIYGANMTSAGIMFESNNVSLETFNRTYKGYFKPGRVYGAPDIVLYNSKLYRADFIYYGSSPEKDISTPGTGSYGWNEVKDPRIK